MAELPKIADEDVKKIDSKLECSICFNHFKEPKLLPCFHIFCKSPCLEKLVVQGREGKSLTCPTCRYLVLLPHNGVDGLQTDFHIEHLFEIRESLEKAKKTDCDNCKEKSSATKYCQQCRKFMCEECTETHQKWGDFSNHKLLDMNEVSADATKIHVCVPTEQIPHCTQHANKNLKIYCNSCSELICSNCTIGLHKDHDYELVDDVFPKHKQELIFSLKPVKQKLDTVQQALKAFDSRARQINDQRATIETDIHREINQLHQLLDQRRVELVASLDLHTQQKLKELATLRDHVEMTHAKMSSCLEYAEGTLETGTESEVLRMKAPVLKRIEEITAEFNPDTIHPQTETNMKLVKTEFEEAQQACREFGEIVCGPARAENIHVTGDGTKFAITDKEASMEMHALTKRHKKYDEEFNLTAELVHTKDEATINCEVKRENGRHMITYKPVSRGKHSLHIRVNDKHIQGSPFPIAVTPSLESLGKPVRVVEELNGPQGVTTNSKGETIVVENSGHCISVLTSEGVKIHSFGTEGSEEEQLNFPGGVTVDRDDNIYVADKDNHRIQKFTPDGTFLAAVGSQGSQIVAAGRSLKLQFNYPSEVAFNKKNKTLYVCDQDNHRIQMLTTDLTFVSCFGSKGSGNGEFIYPICAAFDDSNNLYVTDGHNHRVQVFTPDGEFLRAFTNKANGEQLQYPNAIAIDSSNTVYVSESDRHCVSVFTPQGEYITSFGTKGTEEGQFNGVYGLEIDWNDSIIVSDYTNNRLQKF